MKLNRTFLIVLSLVAIGLIAGACQSSPMQAQVAGSPNAAATNTPSVSPGGARLWEQTCARCHNYRQPSSRTDAEWDVIVHHMRVRANIPASDAREILRFLRAAN